MRRAICGSALCAVLVAGCGGSEPATGDEPSTSVAGVDEGSLADAPDCATLARRAVGAIQAYVDDFEDARPDDLTELITTGRDELDRTASAMRDRAAELSCGPEELRDLLAQELVDLRGTSAVAEGVAGTFRSALLGGEDPSDPGAVELTVTSSDELASALETAGTGSTITIAPGAFRLPRTVVFFRPVTLVGSGVGASTIVSTAEGAAILSLTGGSVAIRDLSIRHEGDAAASLVVVQGGQVDLRRTGLSGARRPADGGPGGYGVVLRSLDRTGNSTITDTSLGDNEGGGVVVAGSEEPTLRGLTLTDNGPCGVCYTDRGAGRLEDSTITRGFAGVVVEDEGRPILRGITVSEVTGAAVQLSGESAADIDALSCDGSDTGVVVLLEDAAPSLGDGVSCPVADGRE